MTNIFSRRTPYNDAYGTCSATRAELLIYPGSIHPSEVTEMLQLQPTDACAVGDVRTSKRGRTRIAKNSMWTLSSEGSVESLDVRRHLDWLLGRLEAKTRELRGLQDAPGVQMSVNCAWYSRVGHGGPTLWPEQMRGLAEMNLECSFDIYFLPDD
jgi:hypothetical protein